MDPKSNPYAPGAGTPPPILAGRDDLVAKADLALARVRELRPAKSFIAVGLRGVGKTVVLNKVQALADEQGYQSTYIEAYDEIRLADALAKALRGSYLNWTDWKEQRISHAEPCAFYVASLVLSR